MSARIGRRNNILAGLFLIGSLLLAVVMSFMLSGLTERLAAAHRYHVWFPVSVGAPGIKPGSPVHLEDNPSVGRRRRTPHGQPEGGRIVLKVSIAHDLVLYPDAKAYLEQPLLGTLSTINIRSLGTSRRRTGPHPAMPRFSAEWPPAFLESAGFGTEQQEKVQNIIDLAEQFVERLHASMEKPTHGSSPYWSGPERIAPTSRASSPESRAASTAGSSRSTAPSPASRPGRIARPVLRRGRGPMADARAPLASAQGVVDDGDRGSTPSSPTSRPPPAA